MPSHLPPPHTVQITGPTEDPKDVCRIVRKHVPRVGRPVDPVQDPASVRVNQPSQQELRMLPDDVSLPACQLDSALVLPPRSMLREQTRPMIPSGVDLHASDLLHPARQPIESFRGCDGSAAFLHQTWVPVCTCDAELVDAIRLARDAAVAQIQPQQVCIGFSVEQSMMAAGAAAT